ncbi:MAG: glycosyltransferase family 2 protein [Magnetococcales bacterium]|nr:glycosyltransferase family 2 protein [Magnetococcales bacterium]
MMRNGLSVIMIGRNEELFLPRTLPPLRRVANEIVFVDTGSDDRTCEIAASFQCRLFHLPWQHDFSQPKNFAIEQAQYRWILSVDCDEELDVSSQGVAALRRCCRSTKDPLFLVAIDNLQADGGVTRHEAMRLFRNDPRIRFNNPVHESICDAIYQHWPQHHSQPAQVRLIHHGYSSGDNRTKLERNMDILRRWVDREPDNLYACYKLGMNLYFRQQMEQSLPLLQRAFQLLDQATDRHSYPFLNPLVSHYLDLLQQQGDTEQLAQAKARIALWGP